MIQIMSSIYEVFIEKRAENARGLSSLSKLAGADTVEQVAIIAPMVKTALRERHFNGAYSIDVNEYGRAIVYQDSTCSLDIVDGKFEVEDLTSRLCVKIAAMFPDISIILDDVKREVLKNKPSLPEEVARLFDNPMNLCLYLKRYSIERFIAAGFLVSDKGYSSDSDWVVSLCNELATQIKSDLIKRKVVKVNLTKDHIAPLSEVLRNILTNGIDTYVDSWLNHDYN